MVKTVPTSTATIVANTVAGVRVQKPSCPFACTPFIIHCVIGQSQTVLLQRHTFIGQGHDFIGQGHSFIGRRLAPPWKKKIQIYCRVTEKKKTEHSLPL